MFWHFFDYFITTIWIFFKMTFEVNFSSWNFFWGVKCPNNNNKNKNLALCMTMPEAAGKKILAWSFWANKRVRRSSREKQGHSVNLFLHFLHRSLSTVKLTREIFCYWPDLYWQRNSRGFGDSTCQVQLPHSHQVGPDRVSQGCGSPQKRPDTVRDLRVVPAEVHLLRREGFIQRILEKCPPTSLDCQVGSLIFVLNLLGKDRFKILWESNRIWRAKLWNFQNF